MDIFNKILVALVLFVGLGLVGCSQDDHAKPAKSVSTEDLESHLEEVSSSTETKALSAKPLSVEQESVKQESLGKHAHEGLSYQKPGAAVRFSHNYSGKSEVGDSESVTLTFNHEYSTGSLSIQLEAQEGLNIADNQSPYIFALDEDRNLEIEALLSAAANGKYYLSIFATVEGWGGDPISRVFALALNAGDSEQKTKSSLEPVHMSIEEATPGNKIILMPAEETISQ